MVEHRPFIQAIISCMKSMTYTALCPSVGTSRPSFEAVIASRGRGRYNNGCAGHKGENNVGDLHFQRADAYKVLSEDVDGMAGLIWSFNAEIKGNVRTAI